MRTYALENRGRAPLYEYLYRCIRGHPGRHPDGRGAAALQAGLAEHLHISVMTVEGAYQQLEAEGLCTPSPNGAFCGGGGAARPAVPAPPAPEAAGGPGLAAGI